MSPAQHSKFTTTCLHTPQQKIQRSIVQGSFPFHYATHLVCPRQTNNVEQTLPTVCWFTSWIPVTRIRNKRFRTKRVSEELVNNPSNTINLDENHKTRRVSDLTEKGKGAFTEKYVMFCQELEALWWDIESQSLKITTSPNELQQLQTVKDKLVESYANYRRLTDGYLEFLKGQKRQEDINACNPTLIIRLSTVELAIATSTKTSNSKRTSHSGSSNVSDMSSLARRKHANADVAKSKIAFIEQHSLILQQ